MKGLCPSGTVVGGRGGSARRSCLAIAFGGGALGLGNTLAILALGGLGDTLASGGGAPVFTLSGKVKAGRPALGGTIVGASTLARHGRGTIVGAGA